MTVMAARRAGGAVLILVLVLILVFVLILVLVLILILVLILALLLVVAVGIGDRHRGAAAGRAAAEEAAREEAAAEAEAARGTADHDRHAAAAAACHRHRGRGGRGEDRRNDRAGDRLGRDRAGRAPHDPAHQAPLGRGVADIGTAADVRLGMRHDAGPGQRVFRDMDCAAADDRTTAGASAEFRQSHSYRHKPSPFLAVPG